MSSPQQPPPPDPQAAQAAVAVLVALAVAELWPSLDLTDLRKSLPAFKAAVAQEVQRHAQGSAAAAARQYRRQRVAAGVGGGFTPRPADPPTLEQIAQTVDWAVEPLWDSAIPVAQFADAPAETRQVASTAIADAKARLAASSEKLVLDTGRDTIAGNVQRDRQAKGWARIPEPGACHFCAMLATRGAVYRSQKSAGFRSHDHCRCHAEPVFTAYEPPARVREWQALYRTTVTDQGRTGRDARVAFRQALEGREVTGATGTPPAQKPASSGGSSGRSQEQIRAELTALENNLPRLTDQQRTWTTQRIDVLRGQLGGAA